MKPTKTENQMALLTAWIDRTLYKDYQENWDDTLFRQYILSSLNPRSIVLDLGAGAGIVPQMNFRGTVAFIYGIDPDERVVNNPYLDEGIIGHGESLPYPDGFFDVAFADNVLEHLAEPERIFCEIARVLKPGGVFLVKTPNKYHYMPMIARLTPYGFHQFYNTLRGRKSTETFPTRYRANTRNMLHRIATVSGLKIDDCQLIEGRPEYLRLFSFTYLLGMLYERAVNKVRFLQHFRILLMARMTKR